MAGKNFSFWGYDFGFGGYNLPPPPKEQAFSLKKTRKSENRLIARDIRQQNKARFRQANNHARCRV